MNAVIETTETTTTYLNDIKFRNAVKRATHFGVEGKNQYRRYVVRIDHVRDEWFTVRYMGGRTHSETAAWDTAGKQIALIHEMYEAGFEHSYVDVKLFNGESIKTSVWRKAGA